MEMSLAQFGEMPLEPVHFKPLGKPIEEGDEPDDWPSEPVRYKPLGKPVEEGDELDPLDDWDEPLINFIIVKKMQPSCIFYKDASASPTKQGHLF